jgi:hypothetical protein
MDDKVVGKKCPAKSGHRPHARKKEKKKKKSY